MKGDLLQRAASALRETAGPAAGDETLARVLRDVRGGARRRRLVGVAALPVALLVMSVGAWAASTGRLAAVKRKLWPSSVAVGSAPVPPRLAPAAAPEIVPLAPPAAPTVPPSRPSMTPAVRRSHALGGRVLGVPAAQPVPADEIYRQAHEAHFVRGDFAAALALWDRYLEISPLPRFAVEARYDRAIALLRLGRRDEAARALRPFAEGDYGAYRAADARALLGAAATRED